MNTYAVIVGIEKYEQHLWDVRGPSDNAIAVARWAMSIGILPANIFAFIDPIEPQRKENEIASLERSGARIVRTASFHEIDEFLHVQLPNCPHNSRLLMYWSGHGCSNERGERVFFCRDYQQNANYKVVNASVFLRTLRANIFRCFTDQILIADVCGTHNSVEIKDPRSPLRSPRRAPQLAYFATPAREYAKGQNDRGVFTQIALDVLRGIGGWPDHRQLEDKFEEAFIGVKQKPFLIQSMSDRGANAERRIGPAASYAGNKYFHTALELLTALDVVRAEFMPSYRRTARDLGIPADSEHMPGILEELSSLRDGGLTHGAPSGLLQFMLRLMRVKRLRSAVDQWLETHASLQQQTLREIRDKLRIEARRRILVVVVHTNERNEIAAFTPYLRTNDLTPVPDRVVTKRAVRNWPDFERQLQDVLAEFVEEGRLQNIEIQFLADPPVFDRPFHRIRVVPGGAAVGEQVVVILRHRRRLLPSFDENLRKDWNDYAAVLRSQPPRQMKWLKIKPGAALPDERGLCFAGFVLTPEHEGGGSCESEKELLSRLLDFGAPFICMPHALPEAADW